MGALKNISIEGGTFPGGGSRDINVQVRGLNVILDDMQRYFVNAESHEVKMINSITHAIMITAQQSSPYLTGHLRAAHRSTVSQGGGAGNQAQSLDSPPSALVSRGGAVSEGRKFNARGVVHIDPGSWNPITMGSPYIYGEWVHRTRNPWFGEVVQTRAPEIISLHSAELVTWWQEVLPGN